MASDLAERVGPALRTLSGIDSLGTEEEVRRRLIAVLDDLAAGLPEDLKTAFSAALGLRDDVRYRFLDERMHWLAATIQRDIRTARRRADEAIQRAAAIASAAATSADSYPLGSWYLARLHTVLRLDGHARAAVEERTVVATSDGLAAISISMGIPRPGGAAAPATHGADFAVLRGGALAASERLTTSYFRHTIALPRPLLQGESHVIAVSITIPQGQPLTPRYAFQPLRRCDEFELRVRFGAAGQDKRIWRLSGLPRGMIDDFADEDALVRPDASGEVHLRYAGLHVGLAYGARWSD
jgi:hypothetical protein